MTEYKKWDHIEFRPTSWTMWKQHWIISAICNMHYHIQWWWLVYKTNVIWLYKEKKENIYLTMEDIADKFWIKDVDSIKIVKVLDCNK